MPRSLTWRLATSEKFWRYFAFFNRAPPAQPVALGKAKSILVIRPDEIGDVILTTPFLRELRRNAARAWITVVVKPACANLLEHCPHVDEIAVYDWEARVSPDSPPWPLRRAAWSLAWQRLRARKFELCLLPRRDPDTYGARFLALFAGAREIVAFIGDPDGSAVEHRFPSPILTRTYFDADVRHEVQHNLELLRLLGGGVNDERLELELTESDRAFANDVLPAGGPYAAFAPGARAQFRRWPVARFENLAARLKMEHGLTPVLVGADGDPVFTGGVSLLGRATLRQSAAVIARSRIFVGNDTGTKHLAAAVRTPVIEISSYRTGGDPLHHNSPDRFHAWGVPHRIVRPSAGAGLHAIDEVNVAAVRNACAELLLQECASC